MSIDSSVIAVIESTVKAEPENVELRLHLTSVLLKARRAQEALAHSQKILAALPDHEGALLAAAEASDLLGERQRAEGYRRLAGALPGPPDAKGELAGGRSGRQEAENIEAGTTQ